jgi:NitT/TauT family transport system substrate-binding protein
MQFVRYIVRQTMLKFIAPVLLLVLVVSCENIQNKIRGDVIASPDSVTVNKLLRKVTVLPYWVTNAQFIGYYLGKDAGIFRKHGIDLEIIPFQPFYTSTDLIKERKVDFAVLWLVNAMELKEQGTDIVNIAQFSFRSSLMLLTKKSSGIRTLRDMNGKKAGIWSGFELQPEALFKRNNLDVKIIPIGSSNNLFLTGAVDIINANWFDEYHSIINSGYNEDELTPFFFSENGLNFPEDGIYCLSEKVEKDPGLCRDFIEATLESWNYAFGHSQESIDCIVKHIREQNMPVNIPHQQWMLDRYRDLYIPKGKTEINTTLAQKDYEFVGNILLESKLINRVPSFNEFYRPYYSLNPINDAGRKSN